MVTIKQMKAYNSNLKRIEGAWGFLNSPSNPQSEKIKWNDKYKQLLRVQNGLMYICKLRAEDHEVLNGFKEG